MKEQELTSRMSEVIVNLQGFDEHTNYHHHTYILKTASECAAIIREFNQLVRELREYIERDPAKLPPLIVVKEPKWEN